ncbi:heat shock factor protein-like isoform X2 [Pecten maximus]|uniref:heat shock factor protein-like isoform X2 n=1 Tax=Pecten maximus TaxID=6579 RepID=UPI001458382C|nr:heat shock factor protein-like isoform X2 [Pecten maximus]
MHSSSGMSSSNVPAFLTKLWALVENPTCDDLICWDQTGNSFHVYDQARFSKEILPLYFKHSNIASFIRQLNMYGFRKVVHIDTGLKTEKDDVEFQHSFFIRGQEHLLENIKRKISGAVPIVKTEPQAVPNNVDKVLTDVVVLKGRQDTLTNRLDTVKRENELLWREVASLRQKHIKQQQIVNKLIQFLVHMVGGNRGLSGMKRKMGMSLMIGDTEEPSNKVAKYSKSMQSVPAKSAQNYSVQSPPSESNDFVDQGSGIIIHDVTDMVKKENVSPAVPVGVFRNANTAQEQASTSTLGKFVMPEGLSLPDDVTNLHSDLVDNIDMFTEGMYPDISEIVSETPAEENQKNMGQAKSDGAAGEINSSPRSIAVNQISNSNVAQQNPPVHSLSRQPSLSEMSDHLDTLQFDIDNLKDALCGGQYSVDPSFLLGLFNPDSPVTISPEMFSSEASTPAKEEDDPTKSSSILGNEVMQYKPSEDVIPDLFDLADLSQAEDDPLSNSSIDTFKTIALETPNVQLSSDELDID